MAIINFRNTPLSNMAFCNVVFNGKTFRSVEHAYMAAKAPDDLEWQKYCLTTVSPYDVKKKSRSVQLRPDWEAVKLDVMWQLLWQKFHVPAFAAYLKSTGDEELIEGNTWKDTFWGYDTNLKRGKNMLGFYLMEIRKTL